MPVRRKNERQSKAYISSLYLARILLGLVLLIILWAGLNPKDFAFHSEVKWVTGGVEFGEYGALISEPWVTEAQSEALKRNGFTVQLALERIRVPLSRFMIVAHIYSGDNRTQFVIGQWRNQLIVMNGNDFNYARREPRIWADLADDGPDRFLFTVSSGPEGTRLYVDDHVAAEKRELELKMPAAPAIGRLALGNSVQGSDLWNATMYGAVLLEGVINPNQLTVAVQRWQSDGIVSPPDAMQVLALYQFAEGEGLGAVDHSGHGWDLSAPRAGVFPGREPFSSFIPEGAFNPGLMRDLLINLIGFIPLGFLLVWVLKDVGLSGGRSFLLALAVGIVISVAMEFLQTWMPSRVSSLLDLLLNSVGTLVGCVIAWLSLRWRDLASY